MKTLVLKKFLKFKFVSVFIFLFCVLSFSWNAAAKNYVSENYKPKLSVIIPVYNTEKYLKQCLDSVVNQTFEDLEIICVNDGSTDRSQKILEEYAHSDSRIKIINQENSGVCAARNKALSESSCDYVTFVDSDDYLEETAYEHAYKNIVNAQADVLIMKWHSFSDNKININIKNPYRESCIKIIGDGKSLINFPVNHSDLRLGVVWDKLYKRSIITENNFKFESDVLFGEDTLFNFILFTKVKKVVVDNNILYHYRAGRKNSITSDLNAEKKAISYINISKHLLEQYNSGNAFLGAEAWLKRIILGFNYHVLVKEFRDVSKRKQYITKFLDVTDKPFFQKLNIDCKRIQTLRNLLK